VGTRNRPGDLPGHNTPSATPDPAADTGRSSLTRWRSTRTERVQPIRSAITFAGMSGGDRLDRHPLRPVQPADLHPILDA
jgi:hypothetical protein